MKKNIDISKFPIKHIFEVPEGYFEQLPASIVQKLAQESSIDLASIPKSNVFFVPADYFVWLPIEIQAQIAELNALDIEQMSKENIFKIPESYFQTLPQAIQEKIQKLQIQYVSGIDKVNVYETPEHFFEGLSAQILQKTISAEENVFSSIPKESVFELPENYFDELSLQIQQKTWTSKARKINWEFLPIPRLRVAMISAVVLLIALLYNYRDSQNPKIHTANNTQTDEKLKKDKSPNKEEYLEQFDLIENSQVAVNQLTDYLHKEYEWFLTEMHKAQVSPQIKQAVGNISKNDVLSYLEENEDFAHEDIMAVYAFNEQASESNDLLLDLQEGEEDILHQLSEQELGELDQYLSKPKKEKEEGTKQ
jgi:hypothetical protein